MSSCYTLYLLHGFENNRFNICVCVAVIIIFPFFSFVVYFLLHLRYIWYQNSTIDQRQQLNDKFENLHAEMMMINYQYDAIYVLNCQRR